MKKKKTILSLLFLAVLMGATYFALEKCGKELDFRQVAQFVSAGKKLCLTAALLCMFLFILRHLPEYLPVVFILLPFCQIRI